MEEAEGGREPGSSVQSSSPVWRARETARDKETEKNSSDQNDYNGLNNYDCVIFKYLLQ